MQTQVWINRHWTKVRMLISWTKLGLYCISWEISNDPKPTRNEAGLRVRQSTFKPPFSDEWQAKATTLLPSPALLPLSPIYFFLSSLSVTGIYSMKITNGNTSDPASREYSPGASPHVPTWHMTDTNRITEVHGSRNHRFSMLSTLEASSVKLKTTLNQITWLSK